MLRQYNGKRVAVLWSGGFDSSALAVMLSECGADVTCYYNTCLSISKLGDVLNRRKITPHLEKLGIKTAAIDVAIMSGDDDLYGGYGPYLAGLVKCGDEIDKTKHDHITCGFLQHDKQFGGARLLFPDHSIEMPLSGMNFSACSAWLGYMRDKYDFLYGLSTCDRGMSYYLPSCSLATPADGLCFKCAASSGLTSNVNYSRLGLKVSDVNECFDDGHLVAGNVLGHIVALTHIARSRPYFVACANPEALLPEEKLTADMQLTFEVRELIKHSKGERAEQNPRPPKVTRIDIYLSELNRLLPGYSDSDFTANTVHCTHFLNAMVNSNYISADYNWDPRNVIIKWRD